MKNLFLLVFLACLFLGCSRFRNDEQLTMSHKESVVCDSITLIQEQDSIPRINLAALERNGNYKFLMNRNIDRMNIVNLPDKIIIMFLSTDSTNLVEYEDYSSISDSIRTTQYTYCKKANAIIISKLNNDYKHLSFTRDLLFTHLSDSLINRYDVTNIFFDSAHGDSITLSIGSYIYDTDLGYTFLYHYPEQTDTIEWYDSSNAY